MTRPTGQFEVDMSAQVVQFPSPTCVCGLPAERRKSDDGCTLIMCDDCYDHRHEMINLVRPVFKTMLECGISEDIASEVMTYLLERVDP